MKNKHEMAKSGGGVMAINVARSFDAHGRINKCICCIAGERLGAAASISY